MTEKQMIELLARLGLPWIRSTSPISWILRSHWLLSRRALRAARNRSKQYCRTVSGIALKSCASNSAGNHLKIPPRLGTLSSVAIENWSRQCPLQSCFDPTVGA